MYDNIILRTESLRMHVRYLQSCRCTVDGFAGVRLYDCRTKSHSVDKLTDYNCSIKTYLFILLYLCLFFIERMAQETFTSLRERRLQHSCGSHVFLPIPTVNSCPFLKTQTSNAKQIKTRMMGSFTRSTLLKVVQTKYSSIKHCS